MVKSITVDVEPRVIEYFINSSGWSKEELSEKLKVDYELMTKWISGEQKINLSQLENLSKYLKRPIAAFLLSEPPKERMMPNDFRTLPNKNGIFEKETILAIRRARMLQEISKDLIENMNIVYQNNIKKIDTSYSSKEIAVYFRNKYNFNDSILKKWKSAYDSFNYLRETIESNYIFVFQFPMPLEDARGFTLVDDNPKIIVVNSNDIIEARIFSLMHEFGHVLLNESGISYPEKSFVNSAAGNVEKWCNDFASEFLLPENKAREIFENNIDSLIEFDTINSLSRKYKVSKSMLIYKMYNLEYISIEEYNKLSSILGKSTKKNKDEDFFGTPQYKICLKELGKSFISLVKNNINKGLITQNEALDFLSIKTNSLDTILGRSL